MALLIAPCIIEQISIDGYMVELFSTVLLSRFCVILILVMKDETRPTHLVYLPYFFKKTA